MLKLRGVGMSTKTRGNEEMSHIAKASESPNATKNGYIGPASRRLLATPNGHSRSRSHLVAVAELTSATATDRLGYD
jgi:hypothetical protein